MSGRRLARRACDGCKIRKIKCTSEGSTCEGCVAAGIACTFTRHPSTRGPRTLRQRTIQQITRTQQQWQERCPTTTILGGRDVQAAQTSASAVYVWNLSLVWSRATERRLILMSSPPSKIASLVLQLCVYRLCMYPVWPIIKVERLIASLQRPQPDIEVFALAYAVAAATITQIKPKHGTRSDGVTAEEMEAYCQNAKAREEANVLPNITTLRIAFFLHIYYENQSPGSLKSISYLREAITISQLLGLHRESYYANVPQEEQQIRRRTLWLLFVTER